MHILKINEYFEKRNILPLCRYSFHQPLVQPHWVVFACPRCHQLIVWFGLETDSTSQQTQSSSLELRKYDLDQILARKQTGHYQVIGHSVGIVDRKVGHDTVTQPQLPVFELTTKNCSFFGPLRPARSAWHRMTDH